MALLTALDYVQKALSIIDADNIDTLIDPTVEGDQVFTLLKTAYTELLSEFPWHNLKEFMTLQVTAIAHIMRLPTDAIGFNWIRYNKNNITYITPIDMQEKLDSRDTTLSSVDSNGALLDRDPKYWTTIDDDNIIFDAYNISLQANLSKIEAIKKPVQLTVDSSRPDINERMEPVLLNMLFAESFRTVKADETRAKIYDDKAANGLADLKRWARRFNKVDSWYGQNYGRRNTSLRTGSTVNIIEGS